jgi:hypothetical protein
MENYHAKTESINQTYGLPEMDYTAQDKVVGNIKKVYYAKSPWAYIESYDQGYIVHNKVVGGTGHYCKTWNEASELRQNLANRYTAINNF